jgi:pimeloyl-ACP methyl ester carboxylesterase
MRPLLFLFAAIAWAARCTTTRSDCTEWITLSGGPARSLVYRTYPLETRNERITRALVVVHGAGRDADNYFRSALAAAFLAGALEDTLVIAPRFASNDNSVCRDALAPNEVNWGCNEGHEAGNKSWRYGGPASGDDRLTSYDLADEVLRKVARKEVFPNLNVIVMAGHSGGGQFVTRYLITNQVHDKLSVPITYVASNATSYVYPDALRPTAAAYSPTGALPGYMPATDVANAGPFRPFGDAKNCAAYDQWPYGFQNRIGYSARLKDEQLKKQLAVRPMTYLLGDLDILPLAGFDPSCPAMAQGPTRLARGQAFGKYASEKYGAPHKVIVVPLCGHNARCMFTADPSLPVLFPIP